MVTPIGIEKGGTMYWRESFRPWWDLRKGSMHCLSTVKIREIKRDIDRDYRTIWGSKENRMNLPLIFFGMM